ncbi:hypothetical protein CLV55_11181, partial [Flavobacterium aciduliphilum]
KEIDYTAIKKSNGVLFDVKGILTETIDGRL